MKCFNCNINECITLGQIYINECCTENFNIFYCSSCYYDLNIPKLCKKC